MTRCAFSWLLIHLHILSSWTEACLCRVTEPNHPLFLLASNFKSFHSAGWGILSPKPQDFLYCKWDSYVVHILHIFYSFAIPSANQQNLHRCSAHQRSPDIIHCVFHCLIIVCSILSFSMLHFAWGGCLILLVVVGWTRGFVVTVPTLVIFRPLHTQPSSFLSLPE